MPSWLLIVVLVASFSAERAQTTSSAKYLILDKRERERKFQPIK